MTSAREFSHRFSSGFVINRPERDHDGSGACCEEAALESENFIAGLNVGESGLAAGDRDQIRIESKILQITERHPAISQSNTTGMWSRRHESAVARQVNLARRLGMIPDTIDGGI